MSFLRPLAAAALLALTGCSGAPTAAPGNGDVILVVGDSLSAGYGLADPGQGWVARMEAEMRQDGFLSASQRIENASVSGETSGGGLERLPELLEEHDPELVVIELGANDALRRQPMITLEQNLTEMVRLSKASGARVLLLKVSVGGVMGLAGGGKMSEVVERVAETQDVAEAEYPLADLMGDTGMMQPDQMHPTDAAQAPISEALDPKVRQAMGQ